MKPGRDDGGGAGVAGALDSGGLPGGAGAPASCARAATVSSSAQAPATAPAAAADLQRCVFPERLVTPNPR